MKQIILFFGFVFLTLFALSSPAKAAGPWPGTTWNAGGPNVALSAEYEITPSDNLTHWTQSANRMGFGVYFPGDTRTAPGSFDVTYNDVVTHSNGSACDTDGVNILVYLLWPNGAARNAIDSGYFAVGNPNLYNGSGGAYNCGGANPLPKMFKVNYNSTINVEYKPEINATVYKFYVWVHMGNTPAQIAAARAAVANASNTWERRGYSFTASSSAGDFGPLNDTAISFFPNGTQGNETALTIPFDAQCTPDYTGTIRLYDSDNDDDFRAQRIGGNAKSDYKPMRLQITNRLLGTGVSEESHDASPISWGNAGTQYWPNDPDSGATRWIRYNLTGSTKYNFILSNYGERNYSHIQLPGTPAYCPNPWDTSGSSSSSARTFLSNNSTNVTFAHTFNVLMAPTTEQITVTRKATGVADVTFTIPAGTAAGSYTGANFANLTHTFDVSTLPPGEYCEYITWSPRAIYDSNSRSSTPACIVIVGASHSAPTIQPYEKGPAAALNVSSASVLGIASGGVCPADVITFSWSYNIVGISSDSGTVNYGGGSCPASFAIPITANTATLNDQAPGTLYPYSLSVSAWINGTSFASNPTGNLEIIEVPFARFYGNDIYARNGDIRFNAAPGAFNSGVGGQGSVSQFGAFNTTATQLIATAAFRFGQPSTAAPFAAQTQPVDGLRATVPAPSTVGAMIDKIQLPVDCEVVAGVDLPSPGPTNIPGRWGSLSPNQKKCYRVDGSGTVDITPSSTSNTDWGYGGKFTIKTTRADGNIYISHNFLNTTGISAGTSYADPNRTAVLMIISSGNIYIDKSVSRIDAILLAKGTIYTCAENSSTGVTVANRDDSCRVGNLTINGVVAAPIIRFERSVGTRLFSNENDHGDTAGIRNLASRGSGYDSAAANTTGRPMASEIVNFPAYLYFSRPYLLDTSNSVYTALFNAAPRY